jgi:ABC-2 type transport system ATP-binding protein
LRDVSFTLSDHQIIGILGPNGAGKTTLLEILEGLSQPTSGAVRLFGNELKKDHYPKERVGTVMQQEATLDKMTVREYAELFAAIYQIDNGADKIIARAQLADHLDQQVAELSGGEAQRLFIAAASVHQPELLFLDEPTAHLDPENRRIIGRWLREMSSRSTIILTTHDLREADAICDYIIFLVNGEVKAQGTPQSLIEAVPLPQREHHNIEDAFFYFCASRLTENGELA